MTKNRKMTDEETLLRNYYSDTPKHEPMNGDEEWHEGSAKDCKLCAKFIALSETKPNEVRGIQDILFARNSFFSKIKKGEK